MNFYELCKNAIEDSIAYKENWTNQEPIILQNGYWYCNGGGLFSIGIDDLMADDWELEKKKEKHLLVIEDVEFYEDGLSVSPSSEKFADWLTLLDKPKMRMTLEWEE